MQITGMLYGGRLLDFVGFPASEVLGPDASEEKIDDHMNRGRNMDTRTAASKCRFVA